MKCKKKKKKMKVIFGTLTNMNNGVEPNHRLMSECFFFPLYLSLPLFYHSQLIP